MRDLWYSDDRDLVKWAVLSLLARKFRARRVLQIAYYNPSDFGQVEIDGELHKIPGEVLSHFRNVGNVATLTGPYKVFVFSEPFRGVDRWKYHEAAQHFIGAHNDGPSIVFLDPDTGLEPNGKADYRHVLNREVRFVWESIPNDSLLVFYQHQTNRSGEPWVEHKQLQLAGALDVNPTRVKIARGPEVARDVVFFYALKG